MLGFWFMASKLFLKIINHIKERYFPQKWFDIDTDSLSINFECSRKYRPPFVQLFSIVFFSTTFSFLFLIQCAVHYIFHYLDFLRDFCSLSESMGWVDYMRIALVVFQNIERATYALETQFKLNTKCQVPNTNWQKSSIFWGGSGKYSKKLPITAYNVVGVAEMSWLYEYLDNMQRAPAQWHIKTVHLRRKAMHRGSKFQCSTLAKIRRVFEFCPI